MIQLNLTDNSTDSYLLEHEPNAPNPVYMQTALFFDQESEDCRAVAREIEAVASCFGPTFSAALKPHPISLSGEEVLPPNNDQLQAWQMLAESNLVVIPKDLNHRHQPAAIVVLPLTMLLNGDQKARGLRSLAQLTEHHSSLVCLFIEGLADGVRGDEVPETDWKHLQRELSLALPRSVLRSYVIGKMLADGRLVTIMDQAAVAAHATLADVVLPNRHATRLLAQSQRHPQVTLGMLGMTGEIRSPEQVAKCLLPRLQHAMFEENRSSSSTTSSIPDDVPTEPRRAIDQAFQEPFPSPVAIAWMPHTQSSYSEPGSTNLICAGQRLRIQSVWQKAGRTSDTNLDSRSLARWRNKILDSDQANLDQRSTLIAKLACDRLQQNKAKDEQSIEHALQESFATHHDIERFRSDGEALILRIVNQQQSLHLECAADDVTESLKSFDEWNQQIQRWNLGIYLVVLSLLISVWIGWWFGITTGRDSLVGSSLAPLTITAVLGGVAVAWRIKSRHAIRRCMQLVEEHLQQRANHKIARQLFQTMQQLYGELFESSSRHLQLLLNAKLNLLNSVAESSRVASAGAIVDRSQTGSADLESWHRLFNDRPADLKKLSDRVRQGYRALARSLIRGETLLCQARTDLERALMQEIKVHLSQKIDVWRRYLTKDSTKPFDDAAFHADYTRWSVPIVYQTRRLFPVRDKHQFTFKTAWICPTVLASRNMLPASEVLIAMNDRILALHRMIWNDDSTWKTT